jgi:hypothetical protein
MGIETNRATDVGTFTQGQREFLDCHRGRYSAEKRPTIVVVAMLDSAATRIEPHAGIAGILSAKTLLYPTSIKFRCSAIPHCRLSGEARPQRRMPNESFG